MNIKVVGDKDMETFRELSGLVGGECGVPNLTIYIDPVLPKRTQQLLVIHSIIENYNRSMPHDKVDELCAYIEDGLDMLE